MRGLRGGRAQHAPEPLGQFEELIKLFKRLRHTRAARGRRRFHAARAVLKAPFALFEPFEQF